ncbi:MAG: hypothetical protein J6X58_02075 [Bacteroidales bacterium]|nr:hypothetical protein [Bacteroidales bacterium]
MKPIVIYTRRFPSRRFHAITLFPFVFHNGKPLDESELRHETIHLWQQLALLLVGFYIVYGLFWLINILRYHDRFQAYMEIPFERSAYELEKETTLTPVTMAFHWVRCIMSSHSSNL